MCKRPCFHDEYLGGIQPATTSTWSTRTAKGVDAIYEEGVVANGARYPLDCIMFATGFETAAAGVVTPGAMGLRRHGRGGASL